MVTFIRDLLSLVFTKPPLYSSQGKAIPEKRKKASPKSGIAERKPVPIREKMNNTAQNGKPTLRKANIEK